MREPKNPWKTLLSRSKNSGKMLSGKQVYTLTWEELEAQFERQLHRCYWLGVKIDPAGIYQKNNMLAPSLDRLDGSKGYVQGNVVITTRFANLGRGPASLQKTKVQMRKLRKQLAQGPSPVCLFDSPAALPPFFTPPEIPDDQLTLTLPDSNALTGSPSPVEQGATMVATLDISSQ